jgi:hypothetical protein
MKDYRQLIKELPSKTIVLACGKFNPPTIGHELLIKAVKSLAEQKNASYAIYASDLSDAKKNPLIVEKKVQYLNLLFPNTHFSTYSDNINETVSKLKETYRKVIVVTSADKVASLKKSLKEATVILAMDKDPDSEDTTRTYAVKGLYEEFKKNLPSAIREIDSRRLMNDLRVGSGLEPIKEEIKLVKDNLREQYFRGEIFNVGEHVESDGQEYEIVKRGSNHLLLKESTGKLVSKWIQNVKLIETDMQKKKLKSFRTIAETYDHHHEEAMQHKDNAEKSKTAGNMGGYHAHMVNHHDSMGRWHESKGRHSSAEHEWEKAEQHHGEGLKQPYVSESVIKEETKIEHHADHKLIDHGHAVQIKIGKEHHSKIGKLQDGQRHSFKEKDGENHWVAVKRGDRLHFLPNHLDTQTMSSMSCHIGAADWNGPSGAAPQDGRQPFDPMSSSNADV